MVGGCAGELSGVIDGGFKGKRERRGSFDDLDVKKTRANDSSAVPTGACRPHHANTHGSVVMTPDGQKAPVLDPRPCAPGLTLLGDESVAC